VSVRAETLTEKSAYRSLLGRYREDVPFVVELRDGGPGVKVRR
jgi:hypothetical protein